MAIPLDGGAARTVAEIPGRSISLSRDGTRVAYLVGGASGGGAGGRGGRGGRGRGAQPAADESAQAPPRPAEIHVRSLADGADRIVATLSEPIASVGWVNDTQLALAAGGGGETIRHEQTPDYSGAKIIYTITERAAGTPADTYVLPRQRRHAGQIQRRRRRRTRRRRALARRVAFPDRSPGAQLQAAQHPRRLDRRRRTAPRARGRQDNVLEHDRRCPRRIAGLARRQVDLVRQRRGRLGSPLRRARAPAARRCRSRRGSSRRGGRRGRPTARASRSTRTSGPNPGTRQIGVATIGADPSHATIATVTSGRGTNIDAAVVARRHAARLPAHRSAELRRPVRGRRRPGRDAKPVRLTDSMPASIDRSALVEPELVHYPGPDGKPVPA